MNRSSGRQLVSDMLIELSKRDDKTSKDAANFIRNMLGVANTIQSSGWIFEIGHDLIEDIIYPQVWETDMCVRCGTKEKVIDFGEEVNLHVNGELARYLCVTCSKHVVDGLRKFLVSAPVKLTAKEQELEDYFKE